MTSASAKHNEGNVAVQQREAGVERLCGRGLSGDAICAECREEPSPWGECIQVEGTVRAKAGASLSV